MGSWREMVHGDPLPWLLEENNPAVRRLALRDLLDRPEDSAEVRDALAAAMVSEPIASILANQSPDGWWVKPGAGYAKKYTGSVWQVIFLGLLGADGSDERVRRGCDYVLAHSQASNGGFSASAQKGEQAPIPSYAIHCLNGNLLRGLIALGWLDDPRLQRAIDWETDAILGALGFRWYAGTCGPGFACGANERKPCAWGAIKAMLGLAAIPEARRSADVVRALEVGRELLLSRDPAVADYPMPGRAKRPNASWFKLGFPSGYVADVLQTLEVLCELGAAGDPRLQHAAEFVLSKQDSQGRWKNEYAYNGKTWVDFERQGEPSKWVTLRALRVLKAIYP